MSTAVITRPTRSTPVLDFDFVRRICLGIVVVAAVTAPFSPDPVATVGGAAVPWVLMRIVGTPTMPSAVVYIFLWQWMQIYARVLQSCIDQETLAGGIFGPDVARAFWYMLASLVVMAAAFRLVLGNLKPPTRAQATAHLRWQANDLLTMYGVALAVSMMATIAIRVLPSLAQVIDGLSRLKIVALVMLFVSVMSTGRGQTLVVLAVLFEVLVGFTGFLSDFRGVFIYLGVSAIAARVKVKGTTMVGAAAAAVTLVSLALFWTSVKMEYRTFAAQSDDSQEIKVALGDRMSYLGERALSSGGMNLSETSYVLLSRLAYTDIFASVIGVQDASPEPIPVRQWTEALQHVFQPRVLFPDKAPLSDTEVYMRLARAFSAESIRLGTSISVGYMAENYADFGFPGMLFGIFVLGLLLAAVIRVLWNSPLPQVIREGNIMGFAFAMARDGVEVSLPKILGSMLMFMIVYMALNKFVFPRAVAWLDQRSAAAILRGPRVKTS